MITEPTHWDLSCDWCAETLKRRPIGAPQDEHELIEWAQQDGWILLSREHYCSRECYRQAATWAAAGKLTP